MQAPSFRAELLTEVEIELGERVVFVWPNNSGKTSAMQALALWDLGVKRWLEKRGGRAAQQKPSGVTLNPRELTAVPVPTAKGLWHDLRVREGVRENGRSRTQNVPIEIVVEGLEQGSPWVCGLAFDYANEESFYCRPIRTADGRLMDVPVHLSDLRLAYLLRCPGNSGHYRFKRLTSSGTGRRQPVGRAINGLRGTVP